MARLTPERLAEIKRRLARAREQHRVYGRVSFTLADMTTLDELLAALDWLRAENARLREQLAAEQKRADDWMRHADSLRCPQCSHPWGPLAVPQGATEDGYRLIWACPCDCHADVARLRADLLAAQSELLSRRAGKAPGLRQDERPGGGEGDGP
jgi:hypothetical protein